MEEDAEEEALQSTGLRCKGQMAEGGVETGAAHADHPVNVS